jgi:probable F420-dependent oxidoreductase
MKFGLIPINIGAEKSDDVIRLAQKAEEVGFESVWTFEHTIIPVDYQSKYPYSDDGKMAGDSKAPIIDPLITLAAIAASTTKLRLATGVNILTQTNPIYMAKQAASLDFMSDGRFMLGVGIGWLREEYVAIGAPFERRGARHDDYVEAIRKMWTGDVVEHKSDFIDWSGFHSYPLPVQKVGDQPAVPIIIGGTKGKIFERVAKLGDGWYAPTPSPEMLEPMIPQLKAACAAEGRDVSSVEISSMWFPSMTGKDGLKRFEDMGVERLTVFNASLEVDPLEGVERFADEYLG